MDGYHLNQLLTTTLEETLFLFSRSSLRPSLSWARLVRNLSFFQACEVCWNSETGSFLFFFWGAFNLNVQAAVRGLLLTAEGPWELLIIWELLLRCELLGSVFWFPTFILGLRVSGQSSASSWMGYLRMAPVDLQDGRFIFWKQLGLMKSSSSEEQEADESRGIREFMDFKSIALQTNKPTQLNQLSLETKDRRLDCCKQQVLNLSIVNFTGVGLFFPAHLLFIFLSPSFILVAGARMQNSQRDPQRMKKSKIDAETQAFTAQLFYFTIKALVLFIFYSYKNYLSGNLPLCAIFFLLLIINTYLMLTTGRDPGFVQPVDKNHTSETPEDMSASNMDEMENLNGTKSYGQGEYGFCDICNTNLRIRSRHCFRCGRCVRKFDHHCPWIGSCVGEKNHFKFTLLTLAHTTQATFAFFVCFKSMKMYEYQGENDTYSPEFGVFGIFAFCMFIYILFAGGLFFFHAFLIVANTTTNELTRRSRVKYLQGIKGNPFNKGLISNLKMAIRVPPEGHCWKVDYTGGHVRERSWLEKVWSNKYYDCC